MSCVVNKFTGKPITSDRISEYLVSFSSTPTQDEIDLFSKYQLLLNYTMLE